MQKITDEYLESQIADEMYWLVPGTHMTLCVLVGKNKVEAVGKSSCARHQRFDETESRRLARADAFKALREAYGIILKNRIYEDTLDGS